MRSRKLNSIRPYAAQFDYALMLAGLFTNLAILLFFNTDILEDQSCRKHNGNVFRDLGMLIYLITLSLRVVISYPISRLSEDLRKKEELVETESVEVLRTVVFTNLAAFSFVKPKNAIYAAIIVSPFWLLALGWSVYCVWRKLHDDKFKKEFTGKKKRIASLLLDGNRNILSLSSTVNVLMGFLFDVFYDTTHEDDYSNQNLITGLLMLLAAALGVYSVVNKKGRSALQFSGGMSNALYYLVLPVLSIYACRSPNGMSGDGFIQKGLWVALATMFLSLPLAMVSGLLVIKSPYDSQDESGLEDSDDGSQCRIFTTLKKQVSDMRTKAKACFENRYHEL